MERAVGPEDIEGRNLFDVVIPTLPLLFQAKALAACGIPGNRWNPIARHFESRSRGMCGGRSFLKWPTGEWRAYGRHVKTTGEWRAYGRHVESNAKRTSKTDVQGTLVF